jgi:hypothetical protein
VPSREGGGDEEINENPLNPLALGGIIRYCILLRVGRGGGGEDTDEDQVSVVHIRKWGGGG